MKFPLYLKIAQILMGLLAFFYILYLGQNIIVPLVFSLILAILLNPVVNWLNRKGIHRTISIALAILLMMIVVGGVFYFIGSQVSMFREALPTLKLKLATVTEDAIDWIASKFNITTKKIDTWIDAKKAEGLNEAGARVGNTLVTLSGMLVLLLLVPVYIFLFLHYKPLLLEFIRRIFRNGRTETLEEVLRSIKKLIQSYLLGLLIEMLLVATLNSTALLIIGIDYAIVLGVIGAILNLVPYIGGIVAISLPMLMGFLSENPVSALFVLFAYIIIQLLDNNFFVPMIVASKVKVNALVSIIVVLIGGGLWGVSGMFLAIPLTAIFKVIFDNVPDLRPYGFLIGDDIPGTVKKVLRSRGRLRDK